MYDSNSELKNVLAKNVAPLVLMEGKILFICLFWRVKDWTQYNQASVTTKL
jgi:hypothetical protein